VDSGNIFEQMSEQTKISWCDSTLNFWEGCTKVSPGCQFCYAEARDKRFTGGKLWGKGAARRKSKSAVKDAFKYNRKPWICDYCGEACPSQDHHPCAERKGRTSFHKRRIFSLSLGDWLDNEVPIEWLAEMLDTIRQCDQVTWMLCTKRLENFFPRMDSARNWLAERHNDTRGDPKCYWYADTLGWLNEWITYNQPPSNIILLASVENQAMADLRIPQLLKIPAACRGLSLEPLLSSIDLSRWMVDTNQYENRQNEGKHCDGRGEIGRDCDRPQGENLETSSKQAGTSSREQSGERLSSSEIHVGSSAGKRTGTQVSLSLESGGDTARPDNQSQERIKGRQQAGELGTGDISGANQTREDCVGKDESGRRKQQLLETKGGGSSGDSETTRGGRKPQLDSGGVRNNIPTGVENSARRPMEISWCIIGGESGPNARPCNVDWIRSLVEQGDDAGVATFVKQLGSKPVCDCSVAVKSFSSNCCQHFPIAILDKKGGDIFEWPIDLQIQEWPNGF
jgi:protein gp37